MKRKEKVFEYKFNKEGKGEKEILLYIDRNLFFYLDKSMFSNVKTYPLDKEYVLLNDIKPFLLLIATLHQIIEFPQLPLSIEDINNSNNPVSQRAWKELKDEILDVLSNECLLLSFEEVMKKVKFSNKKFNSFYEETDNYYSSYDEIGNVYYVSLEEPLFLSYKFYIGSWGGFEVWQMSKDNKEEKLILSI